jgi:hypothetical protein
MEGIDHVQPAAVFQPQVEDGEGGRPETDELQCVGDASGLADGKPPRLEGPAQPDPKGAVIIQHQQRAIRERGNGKLNVLHSP